MSKRYIKLESGAEVIIGHPLDDVRTLTVGGTTVKLTKEEVRKLAWYLEADADGVKRNVFGESRCSYSDDFAEHKAKLEKLAELDVADGPTWMDVPIVRSRYVGVYNPRPEDGEGEG